MRFFSTSIRMDKADTTERLTKLRSLMKASNVGIYGKVV